MVITHLDFNFRDDSMSFLVRAVEVRYSTHTAFGVTVIDQLGHRTLPCDNKPHMDEVAQVYLMVANKAIYAKYL